MNRLERIKSILTEKLHPAHLEVRDDSVKHAGHAGARAGGETHYEVIIEAECFRGVSKIQRHQMIYKLLTEEFNTGLHALTIKAQAIEEAD
jgi:BolA protein